MKFKLYKYRSINNDKVISDGNIREKTDYDRVIDIVNNNQLYMGRAKHFNDIYEMRTGVLQEIDKWFDCSCCTTWDADTMWGYYAESHRGVVVEFIFDTDNHENACLYKVRYGDPKDYEQTHPIESGCIYKHVDWNHEREYRIIRMTESEDYDYTFCSINITGLIFGRNVKTDDEYVIALKDLAQNKDIRIFSCDEYAEYMNNRDVPYAEYSDWRDQIIEHERFWLRPNDKFSFFKQERGQEWYRILDLRTDTTVNDTSGTTKALLISENILETKPYHTECEEITWRDCSLREWLKTDYYNNLPQTLRERIIPTDNYLDGMSLSNPEDIEFITQDLIFCLSADEAKFFFASDSDRAVLFSSPWWLRKDGAADYIADSVRSGGLLQEIYWIESKEKKSFFKRVEYKPLEYGVRPAFWLKMQVDKDSSRQFGEDDITPIVEHFEENQQAREEYMIQPARAEMGADDKGNTDSVGYTTNAMIILTDVKHTSLEVPDVVRELLDATNVELNNSELEYLNEILKCYSEDTNIVVVSHSMSSLEMQEKGVDVINEDVRKTIIDSRIHSTQPVVTVIKNPKLARLKAQHKGTNELPSIDAVVEMATAVKKAGKITDILGSEPFLNFWCKETDAAGNRAVQVYLQLEPAFVEIKSDSVYDDVSYNAVLTATEINPLVNRK
jgi:hypothetical protein